ncbi:xanthine dehydrogenase family protein molybdopterin-binding subunit [Propylenella binzhouense]|uniref:Xanthine dehydrogenase family protein molybdopterin-binding subunit n=1 Tax=Propylenella binzhouense TaxID=2555902 RepID=A0A964T4H9_9HYPH|nr:xanthine dehydrogenase family protein molybdopterin-binding subunit [Propylenella binzhouense]MYZ47777.1 xanthine dehydrogenase family protein molybdopterin-binding subunit [Propylenella binzhouense]
MTELAPLKFGLGAPVRRLEDPALLRGSGRFTADVTPAGALHAYVLRSAAAHARISLSGLEDARRAAGVHLVWTAADVADLGSMPCEATGPIKAGSPGGKPFFPVLCSDVVRHVGDAIAFVVAEDALAARTAAEAILVDYDPLPAAVGSLAALAPDAPLVWPERGTNVAFEYEHGDAGATEAAFAQAKLVAELTVENNRLVCNYMEPRAAVAEFDPSTDRYTLTLPTQGVHGMQASLAGVLKVPPAKLRVVTPDVGGGFGVKAVPYREYVLAAKAAKALGRPVKWVSDRNEHFLADAQGRDNVATAAFALDGDGRILAMRVNLVADMGAYLSHYGPIIPWLGLTMATGLYDIRTIHLACTCVFTNTVPTDAYRGAGRPEAAYLVERLMDHAARVAGLSPAEIRRRNFIRPEQMPYRTQTGRLYDTGEFDGHMERALERADFAGFEARAAESKARGRVRGIGFATYIEACAFPGSEVAKAVLEPDGRVALHIGTQSNGQGHQTAYAQFLAEPLGLDYDHVRVVQGDTDLTDTGGGTGGSRSIPLGVPSVEIAARTLAEKIKALASDELEASAADIELVGGSARIAGTDRSIGFAELAARAGPATLVATGEYKSEEPTYPNGTHLCEVEIDPETGATHVLAYLVVDDFGVVVNPLLLAGQVHGGVVQGIGQALLERTVYDADGQLVTASFNDYAMPRAWDVPSIGFETRNIPSKWNPLGIKGAGEAGSIGSCPAVMNAVVDALDRGFGIRHIDMPATPVRVWEAIRGAAR